jgi:hypothetical protein
MPANSRWDLNSGLKGLIFSLLFVYLFIFFVQASLVLSGSFVCEKVGVDQKGVNQN